MITDWDTQFMLCLKRYNIQNLEFKLMILLVDAQITITYLHSAFMLMGYDFNGKSWRHGYRSQCVDVPFFTVLDRNFVNIWWQKKNISLHLCLYIARTLNVWCYRFYVQMYLWLVSIDLLTKITSFMHTWVCTEYDFQTNTLKGFKFWICSKVSFSRGPQVLICCCLYMRQDGFGDLPMLKNASLLLFCID